MSLHEQNVMEALKMVQLGQIAAADAGDAGEVARLQATAAWAYALMGKQRQAVDSLARAEYEMNSADASEPWMTIFFASHGTLKTRPNTATALSCRVPLRY
ncbi:hypothetical protein ACLMAJ_12545 [Nocardia sp. KC 131]|uniref:hypothetical protein n=1 Tax=Nocardia arseniciresistens TaxID=3392119 RepID=UPI00398EC279